MKVAEIRSAGVNDRLMTLVSFLEMGFAFFQAANVCLRRGGRRLAIFPPPLQETFLGLHGPGPELADRRDAQHDKKQQHDAL
jgi:hypothetical protein